MLKGEAIQGCGVVLGAAHPKEFSFPVFVRVLEEGEEDPARDPEKAYPEAFPLLLHFEEMQENIHGGKDAQVPAENLKTPYKCPAVGVELGGGCINLGEEFPLKGGKWETHSYAFKHRLVHKEEGVPLPRSVVQADRFSKPAGTDGYVSVVSAAESVKVIQVGIPTMSFQSWKVVRLVHSFKSSSGAHG